MSSIALDVGTSAIKAILFDQDNHSLAEASRPTPVRRSNPGWAEYDPEEVWRLICAVVAELGEPSPEFLIVTGQSDGCWATDRSGRALRNAIVWNDGRAHAILQDWTERGVVEQAFRINGATLFPGAQATLLKWIERNEPEVFDRLGYVLCCKDYFAARMTGEIAAEPSDSSVPWLDIERRAYSSELLALYDMPWATRFLPPLHDGAPGRLGLLLPKPGGELGIIPGTPVMSSLFDCPAMAVGAGVTRPGQALVVLGTSLVIQMVIDGIDNSGKPGGMTLASGFPNTWLRLFGTMSCTDGLNWMSGLLGLDSAADLFSLAAKARLGSGGLRILPYFSPAGERAPFLDPSASGTILGMTLDHSREELARAMVEALTCSLLHCVEALPSRPTEMVLAGGGARSDFWCQMIADATGVAAVRLEYEELGVLGANLWGRCGLDGAEPRLPHSRLRQFEPNPVEHARYRALLGDYLFFRDNIGPAWGRIFSEMG